jgi:hypothetical protein
LSGSSDRVGDLEGFQIEGSEALNSPRTSAKFAKQWPDSFGVTVRAFSARCQV